MDTQHRSTPINIGAALLAAAVTAGLIFVLGRATGSVQQHGMALAAVAVVGLAGLWFGLRRSRALRAWSIGGVVVTLVAALALGGLLSRPTEVNEQVVTASETNELLAEGELEPLAHAGEGTASVIRTGDGRTVLTLTDFETDAGPDLFVWLVAGDPNDDGDVEDGKYVSLGKLKATSGDQQYVLPKDVDPAEFTHAYVWCRAFSVGFTRAKLA